MSKSDNMFKLTRKGKAMNREKVQKTLKKFLTNDSDCDKV